MSDTSKQSRDVPRPRAADESWKQKADQAMRAREMGKQIRAGKPSSFRNAVGRHA